MTRFHAAALLLPGLIVPGFVFAQTPPVPVITEINPCFGPLGLPCLSGVGGAGLSAYAQDTVLPAAQTIFLAMALLYFFYYAVRMMLESSDENVISETKSAYVYGVSGAVVVTLATFIADAFTSPGEVVDTAPIGEGLDNVIEFMRLAVSISVSAAIVFLGVRLIVLQGEESEIEQQKKRFFNGLLGVAIVLLANVAVEAFIPGGGPSALASEIAGIASFVLTLLGALAVLAFVVAGVFLVLSTDEGLKDRAKKIIFATVVTIIVVLSSLAIVKFVINL